MVNSRWNNHLINKIVVDNDATIPVHYLEPFGWFETWLHRTQIHSLTWFLYRVIKLYRYFVHDSSSSQSQLPFFIDGTVEHDQTHLHNAANNANEPTKSQTKQIYKSKQETLKR